LPWPETQPMGNRGTIWYSQNHRGDGEKEAKNPLDQEKGAGPKQTKKGAERKKVWEKGIIHSFERW